MRTPLAVVAVLLVASPAFATSRTGLLVPEVAEVYDAVHGVIVPAAPPELTLRRGKRRVRVAPDRRYLAGAKLRVRGQVNAAGVLVPDSDVRGVKVLRMPPQIPAFPVERLLVLLVDHPGAPRTRTRASIAADFDHLAMRVGESSYGHTVMDVTVLDWQTTPPVADCTFAGLLQNALLAHAGSVDYRAFTLVNVVEPEGPICADGTGGAGGGAPRITLGTPSGAAYLGMAITGVRWAASLHEIGHAMGLTHANSLDCPTPGVPLPALAGCVNQEYGDPFDTMGQAFGDFDVLHKRQLGWIKNVGPETVQTVTTAGTYTIEPLEVPSLGVGPKGLLLLMPTSPPSWLVLETRMVTGLDRLYPDDWFDGVFLHASVIGFALPNYLGTVETQGPLASHFVWPTTSEAMSDTRIPTGSGVTVWPWRIQVLSRDPGTKVVTVQIDDVRTLPPPPTPTAAPTPVICGGVPCPPGLQCNPGNLKCQ